MKILYGVQATGNGHITRARAMSKQLKALDIEVDYFFSGRAPELFFDMDEFGQWRSCKGLTFVHEAGDLKIVKTLKENSLIQAYRDIKNLDLSPYDLVLTDFEPISARAAKRTNKTCIGLGHQYAFGHGVPVRGDNFVPKLIMRNFAPVDIGLGLHWHHFNKAILPPIAETHSGDIVSDPNKIVVYLGFESPEDVISLLEPFDDYLFTFYGPFAQYESRGHIQLKPLSREGFKRDLASAGGVICNAGFELSSEAIQLGKKLLMKPLMGQMEQLSNAKAIELLGLGMTMDSLDGKVVRQWLQNFEGKRVQYPNVAQHVAAWLKQGDWFDLARRDQLVMDLWQDTQASGVEYFTQNPVPSCRHDRVSNGRPSLRAGPG